jgi:Zn-dependent M28 family amino/carboxypeptidase
MTRLRRSILALVLVLAGVAAAHSAPATFDGAAALRHIERLVALGPRVAGSPGGARARAYITGELQRAGIQTRVEPFDADTPDGRIKMANVVAVLPGHRPEAILIGGHYDTKLFPDFKFVGANDGGSSAALLIELARALARRPRGFTYWIAFFDGEEARGTWTSTDSLYGSRRMAADLARQQRLPVAMIVADMIGDRDLDIRREGYSTPWITDLVWESARRLGHAAHFLSESMSVEDDHAPFLRAGVPATLLIDFSYLPWHTADDTLDKVSARSLQVVGDVLLEALPAIEQRLGTRPGGQRP